jgi:glutathionylspermidine synthase
MYLPDDAPESLKKIKARMVNSNDAYQFLVDYSTPELEEIHAFLVKCGKWNLIKRDVERELKMRQPCKQQSAEWLEPLWYAVMSLFGKGYMDRHDKETLKILERV